MSSAPDVRTCRVKDADEESGVRVLVDRLWPRGQRKDSAPFDHWVKAAAPSSDLRKWYDHDPDRFDEFATRYRDELDSAEGRAAVDELVGLAGSGDLVLVTATHDLDLSHAKVLAERIRRSAAASS